MEMFLFTCKVNSVVFHKDQFNFSVFHSYKSPATRIIRKIVARVSFCVRFFSSGIGNSREISISKIRNSTAVVKNCIDSGLCGFIRLTNPHSNGDHLFCVCSEINAIALGAMSSVAIKTNMMLTDIKVLIDSFLFVWKTNVQYVL